MFLLKDWTYVGRNDVVATITLRSTWSHVRPRSEPVHPERSRQLESGITTPLAQSYTPGGLISQSD